MQEGNIYIYNMLILASHKACARNTRLGREHDSREDQVQQRFELCTSNDQNQEAFTVQVRKQAKLQFLQNGKLDFVATVGENVTHLNSLIPVVPHKAVAEVSE